MGQHQSLSIYQHVSLCLCILCFQANTADANARFESPENYFTYLGGENSDSAYSMVLDTENNIYISGQTNSLFFDQFSHFQNHSSSGQNCFILKLSAENSSLDYLYIFAGSQRETCRDIAVDSENNVYLTGETQSPDLPVTTNRVFSGEWDSFLLKLNSRGRLVYASYIGGSLTDYGHGLSVQDIDQVFIAGETWSLDFPTTENAFMENCIDYMSCDGSKANAFVTHIDTSLPSQFVSRYSSYLGGSNQDKAHDLSIDANGLLHIVGETRSDDFPLNNQLQDTINGTYDGFLAIISPENPRSRSLIMSTYLGGSDDDFIFAVTTDDKGNTIVTGETRSDDFPVSENAFSTSCDSGYSLCTPSDLSLSHSDSFVSIIQHSPVPQITYSSLFGGSADDVPQDVLIQNQIIFVTGLTWSDNFPVTSNAYDNRCNTDKPCKDYSDGFLIKLDLNRNSTGSLVFSSFLGGNDNDQVYAMSQSSTKKTYLAGETFSQNLANRFSIDSSINNAEAFLQIISINSDGFWVDKPRNTQNSRPPEKVSASILSDYFLSVLTGLLLLLRSGFDKSTT